MTHISRPIQIALAVAVLFLAVWFFALRSHSSTTESSGSGASGSAAQSSSSSSQSSASQSTPGGGSPASKGGVYHGSAPGVEGLSRAIQKARGAVAQSQQNAQQQQRSQSQSAQTQTQGQSQKSQSQTSQQRQQTQAKQNQSRQTQNSQQTKAAAGVPPMQATIEGELKHGKVVAVLFWNPRGTVDATVRRELRAAGRAQHGKLAVHVARSSQIGSFGSFAHAVQVYSTPTILLINTHGKISSLTGLTDVFSIGQAIKEVKHAR